MLNQSFSEVFKIRIPCTVANIEALDDHHVRVRVCGKPNAELILKMYRFLLAFLQLRKNHLLLPKNSCEV